MSIARLAYSTAKWLLFPGINLHARLRYRVIGSQIGCGSPPENRWVLDAGCGNGMLALRAYLRGNNVIAVSIKEGEISRNRDFFNNYLKIPKEKLRFLVHDLYEIDMLGQEFDEIVCCEVLEHIRDDRKVCSAFFKILKPGGILHLCCPNAEHPDNMNHELDTEESGGHVRPGYTEAQYRTLLEPLGFQVGPTIGLGGKLRQSLNKAILRIEKRLGLFAAVLFFLAVSPMLIVDEKAPRIPYSLYVRASKPAS